MPTHLICQDCGLVLEHDTDAERWLKEETLYAPDQLDVDNNGQHCAANDGDPHRIATAYDLLVAEQMRGTNLIEAIEVKA